MPPPFQQSGAGTVVVPAHRVVLSRADYFAAVLRGQPPGAVERQRTQTADVGVGDAVAGEERGRDPHRGRRHPGDPADPVSGPLEDRRREPTEVHRPPST